MNEVKTAPKTTPTTPVFSYAIFGEENLLGTQAPSDPSWSREQYLFLAVLQDGIGCALKYAFSKGRKAQRLEQEAMDWILALGGEEWPCSFLNCCLIIGTDPDYIRRGVLRKREEMRAKALQWKMRSVREQAYPILPVE